MYLLILALIIGYAKSQSCSSPNITNSNFMFINEDKLNLKYDGEVFQTLIIEEVLSIDKTDNGNLAKKYIDARLNGEFLDVFITKNFKNYAEEQTGQTITLTVDLKCEDLLTKKLIFIQNLEESNDHDPEFSQKVYEFAVPLPLRKGLDLTEFMEISARDIDLFGNEITFSSEYSGIINIDTRPASDGKTFYAGLILSQWLVSISGKLEFTLVATDQGEPPRHSTAQIIISRDGTNSLPSMPQFEKPLHVGILNEEGRLEIEKVIINLVTYTADVSFEKSGVDADLFKLTNDENIITISMENNLPEDYLKNKQFLNFEITAIKSEVQKGSTAIMVKVPQLVADLKFEKILYQGKIDSSKNLDLEDIYLDKGSYSDSVKFTLSGVDKYLFQISNQMNKVNINLKSEASSNEDWKHKKFLTVIIEAIKSEAEIGSTVVLIAISEVESIPKFENHIYNGLIDENNILKINRMRLINGELWENIQYSLEGMYKDHFGLEQSSSDILLKLINKFSDDELYSIKLISLTLIVRTLSNLEGYTQIILDLPGPQCQPQFENFLYETKFNKDGQLDVGNIVLKTNSYTDNIIFKLEGDEADYFTIESTLNAVKIINKTALPENVVKAKTHISLIILAQREKNVVGAASLIISLPVQNQETCANVPQFSKPLYRGTLNAAKKDLRIESIALTEETYELGIEYKLLGNDADIFDYDFEEKKIILKLKQSFDEEKLSGKFYLQFMITAITIGNHLGTSAILIDLGVQCGETTTTPTMPNEPIFDNKFYSYSTKPDYVGIIGTVTATINTPQYEIQYGLEVADNHLKSRIYIDKITGKIFVTNKVSPGIYNFILIATDIITESQGFASAKLNVDSIIICGNRTYVDKSLLIKHIAEEIEHSDLFSTEIGDCEYKIIGMEPNDREYVHINSISKMLEAIVIDREDEVFANMIIPQIQIKLKLACYDPEDYIFTPYRKIQQRTENISDLPKSIRGKRAFPILNEEDDRYLVLTDDIDFATDITVLSVIIEDINDHTPEFLYPQRGELVLGYPVGDVAANILPEYLVRVEASDRDDGLNAKIRYSIEENDHFGIEPYSGVIYPFSNCFLNLDEVKLIVYATDRDGASDGKTNTITIYVKKLMSEHLLLLTIPDSKEENLRKIFEKINENSEIHMIAIRNVIVPISQSSNTPRQLSILGKDSRSSSELTTIKAWIYGVDKNNKLLESSLLRSEVLKASDGKKVETEKYSYWKSSEKIIENETDTTGLVAAVCVLALILFGILGAGIFVWWYFRGTIDYKQILKNQNGHVSSDTLNHEMGYKNSSSLDFEEEYQFTPSYEKRESIRIAGTTLKDTSDDRIFTTEPIKTHTTLNDANECEENENRILADKRKSVVTFNKLVERIDIERIDKSQISSTEDERL